MRFIKLKDIILTEKFSETTVVFNKAKRLPYVLNPTAAEIINFCKREKSEDEIINYLHKIYGVGKNKLKNDVKSFLAGLKRKGIVDIYV